MPVQRYPTATDEEREAAIDAASLAVQRGELVVLPTDTVYGVAADAFDPEAVAALLEAKGRGREMPPPVLVSAATTLDALAVRVPDYARALVEEFWPGPLTLVCHQQASLQWDLGDTRGTVAVRMPDHEVALELLERTGPLAVSSANLTGSPAATDADEAEQMLGERRRRARRRGCVARRRGLHDHRRHRHAGRVLRRGARRWSSSTRCSSRSATPSARTRHRGHGDPTSPRAPRVREYVLVFLVAAAVTYLLTVVAREIALRTGAVAEGPRPRRARRADAVPRRDRDARRAGGGVPRRPGAAVPLRQRGRSCSRTPAIVFAGALVCAVGVLDDIFDLDALTKLGGQVLAAGFLVDSGIQLRYFFPTRRRQPVLPRPGPGCAAHRL